MGNVSDLSYYLNSSEKKRNICNYGTYFYLNYKDLSKNDEKKNSISEGDIRYQKLSCNEIQNERMKNNQGSMVVLILIKIASDCFGCWVRSLTLFLTYWNDIHA